MKEFFKVTDLASVVALATDLQLVGTESCPLTACTGRILADNIVADHDLPEFPRATMDGYAVNAASTFGASESNPAYLTVKGSVTMGQTPAFDIEPGEACRISTGGMLPKGADSVVMIEHTEILDETTIEIYRGVAPGQHVIEAGEDFSRQQIVISTGTILRPQEVGLLAAFGRESIPVFKKPVIAVISTGDEIIPVGTAPRPGQIRDINTFTLTGQVESAGGRAVSYGIVPDNGEMLYDICRKALLDSDMVLLSGGSSVGTRDFTVDVLRRLPDCRILIHGISISPGKPTILAKVRGKAIWGLPGHVVSAMVVFKVVVQPFLEQIAGVSPAQRPVLTIPARMGRNVVSAQGRTDFVRVRLFKDQDGFRAEPMLGKSGLLNSIVQADGLVEIDINTEGLDAGDEVDVMPF